MRKLILLALACVGIASAQNAAQFLPSPVFTGFDNNGAIVGGGKLCTYYANTTTPAPTYSDAAGVTPNTDPIILDASGRARIYSNLNLKLVLQQPGDSSCPGTGAVIWTMDGVFSFGLNPVFNTVVATTFNSTATGTTPAFQQQYGTFTITGAGDAAFQSVEATSTFNSLATGTTSAFQTQTGTFEVFGNGTFQGQQDFVNQIQLQGFAGPPASGACTSCSAPGSGYGLLAYNTLTGTVQFNLNNGGWQSIPVVPGSTTQVIYNDGGALGASAFMTFSGATLSLNGGSSTGVVAPVFNSSNTGTNSAFQTSTGNFYVLGNGSLGAQSVTAHNTANSMSFLTGVNYNTDTSGQINLSGGTYTMFWPSGHSYTSVPVCVVSENDTVPHSVAGVATNVGMAFYGTGSDTVNYLCVGGVY